MQSLLIIDDEPNVCYTLEKVLGSARLKVLTAGTAGDGLEAVRRESPDAVILDVRLPDMSGLDAYRQIRQIDARLPVIIITAHGTTETAIEAMKLGAFDYLLKPLDLDQLRDVVARADPPQPDQPHAGHVRREASRRRSKATNWSATRRPCRSSTSPSAGSPRRT